MCIMSWEDGENRVLVKIHKNTFFVLYLLISPTKSTFSFGEKILVALDAYAKEMNPLSIVLVGGGAR